MKKLILALALIWATPLYSMDAESTAPELKLVSVEVRSPAGALWQISIEGKPLPALGSTIHVRSVHPQTNEVYKFDGVVTAHVLEAVISQGPLGPGFLN